MANIDREKVTRFVPEIMELAENRGISELEVAAAFSTMLVAFIDKGHNIHQMLAVLGNTAAGMAAGSDLCKMTAKKIMDTPENYKVPVDSAVEISAYLSAMIYMFGNHPCDPAVIQQAANMFAIAHCTRHHKEEAYLLSAANFAIDHAMHNAEAGIAASDVINKAMGK